ncbi:hypothetical protein BKA62DRAFT_717308 [Auriculariales sp. MPI-PUGE-AT-0066]|nr:hypothetical protein BKA62DRAFT_717308 [Auriculariales sp. MPI-PUGE-AT-0066]
MQTDTAARKFVQPAVVAFGRAIAKLQQSLKEDKSVRIDDFFHALHVGAKVAIWSKARTYNDSQRDLPVELWSLVFRLGELDQEDVLRVSHVSRSWRTRTIKDTFAWSKFFFDGRKTKTNFIRLFIEHSGDLPFELNVRLLRNDSYQPLEDLSDLIKWLQADSRIRTFRYSCDEEQVSAVQTLFSSLHFGWQASFITLDSFEVLPQSLRRIKCAEVVDWRGLAYGGNVLPGVTSVSTESVIRDDEQLLGILKVCPALGSLKGSIYASQLYRGQLDVAERATLQERLGQLHELDLHIFTTENEHDFSEVRDAWTRVFTGISASPHMQRLRLQLDECENTLWAVNDPEPVQEVISQIFSEFLNTIGPDSDVALDSRIEVTNTDMLRLTLVTSDGAERSVLIDDDLSTRCSDPDDDNDPTDAYAFWRAIWATLPERVSVPRIGVPAHHLVSFLRAAGPARRSKIAEIAIISTDRNTSTGVFGIDNICSFDHMPTVDGLTSLRFEPRDMRHGVDCSADFFKELTGALSPSDVLEALHLEAVKSDMWSEEMRLAVRKVACHVYGMC